MNVDLGSVVILYSNNFLCYFAKEHLFKESLKLICDIRIIINVIQIIVAFGAVNALNSEYLYCSNM